MLGVVGGPVDLDSEQEHNAVSPSSAVFGLKLLPFCVLFHLFSASVDGVAAFRAFLKTEFSEENLEFWLACEEFKKTRSTAKLVSKAHRIFEEFVDVQAPREVNIDHETRELTRINLQAPTASCFDVAQGKTRILMEKDSYPRFLKSPAYRDLATQVAAASSTSASSSSPAEPSHT
ncbi:Regulator of G-protein signaling 16 [Lemmus lemmus]